jgi:hypothetical protein
MARNKKHEADLRVAPILLVLATCALLAGLGVGFVWYKNQIDLLGRQIKERELRLAELQRENKMRRDQWATLSSPVALDARVKKLNLGLGPPALSQVIRLMDAPVDEPAAPPWTPPSKQPVKVALAARKN